MGRTDIHGVLSFECNYWNFQQEEEPPVYPFCEEEVARISPSRMGMHRVSYLLFSVMLSGRIHYVVEGKDYILCAGEAMVIPMDSLYMQESFTTEPYVKQVLEIRGSLVKAYAAGLRLDTVRQFRLADPEEISGRLRRIGKLLRANHPGDEPELIGQTHYLMSFFARAGNPGASLPPLFYRIRDEIENLLDRPFSVAELSRRTGASHSTMDRLMRRFLGMSCREYYLRRKMLAAEYLLKNTELSIKEIAYRLGCSSAFHFSNLFHDRYGVSPSSFRENALESEQITCAPEELPETTRPSGGGAASSGSHR